MPNAGLPRAAATARTTRSPRPSWPTRTSSSSTSSGSVWSAAAAAPPRSTCAVVERPRADASPAARDARAPSPAWPSSTSTSRSARTPPTSRSASAPTPTAPRRSATRCSRSDWDDCVEIARDQIRDGAHLLDLCVDYVGRDGAADMHALAARFATASTLPLMLDSTEPAVLEAGLELLGGRAIDQLRQLRGRRRARLRFAVMPPWPSTAPPCRPDHRRGGPGPHRRLEGRGRPPLSTTWPATGGWAPTTSSSTA